MITYSKVCDAADWFRPGIQGIIDAELREPARFHRKQWEFAVLFNALRGLGMLDARVKGLSMGGGTERLLYSLANHVEDLVVTDLYSPGTTWDCARTVDPEDLIRSAAPFPVDLSRVTALYADMRALPFPDGTFDFCYSTCAIEHIGEMDDFRRHFEEVHRVLKDGGVYAFTTEFHYGPETITDPENYIFSWACLRDLLHSSPFLMEERFDARVARHTINDPRPPNIGHLVDGPFHSDLPHVQLLRGRHPFTAALFVLRKVGKSPQATLPEAIGLSDSLSFLEDRIGEYVGCLNETSVRMNPFSSLPRGVSPWFADHAAFFPDRDSRIGKCAVFHTDYYWWGAGKRTFRVSLSDLRSDAPIEVRVHAYETLSSKDIRCVAARRLSGPGECATAISLETRNDCCYAILGNVVCGSPELSRIVVESVPNRGDGGE